MGHENFSTSNCHWMKRQKMSLPASCNAVFSCVRLRALVFLLRFSVRAFLWRRFEEMNPVLGKRPCAYWNTGHAKTLYWSTFSELSVGFSLLTVKQPPRFWAYVTAAKGYLVTSLPGVDLRQSQRLVYVKRLQLANLTDFERSRKSKRWH